jgi:hypothetical protein
MLATADTRSCGMSARANTTGTGSLGSGNRPEICDFVRIASRSDAILPKAWALKSRILIV